MSLMDTVKKMGGLINYRAFCEISGEQPTEEEYIALILEFDSFNTREDILRVLHRSTGLGDTISKITHRLGIEECGGCQARKVKANGIVPYSETVANIMGKVGL